MGCASEQNIEVHHVDGDRNNNDPDNLVPLCRDCHTKLHAEGLNGLEKHLKPVSERSHIDSGMTTAQIGVERSLWEDWKMTVPRNKSLETRINELIEADKNGNVTDD
jgi:hypothetical protein